MGICSGNSDSLCLPVCLSNLGSRGLPCDLTFHMDQRRVVDFLVFWVFLPPSWNSQILQVGLEILVVFTKESQALNRMT